MLRSITLNPRPDGLEIDMGASLELVDSAVDHVTGLCRTRGLGRHIFAIVIIMREGLTNAVRHGAHLDPSKPVRFSICFEKHYVHMEFEDHGPGFDWRKAFEAISSPNSEGGRGIEIIRQYSHSFCYRKEGRLLQVTIRVG